MAEGVSKICVLCGADVSNTKRVKDPAGKYYCEPCYGQAKAQTNRTAAAPVAAPSAPRQAPAAPPPAPRRPASASAVPAAPAMLSDPDELMLKDEPPRRGPAAAPPPAPRAPAAADAGGDELMLKDDPPKGLPKGFVIPECVIEPPDEVDEDEEVAAPAAKGAQKGTEDPLNLPAQCPACGTKRVTNSRFCLGCQRDMTKMDKLAAIMADGAKDDSTKKAGRIIGRTIGVIAGVAILCVAAFILWGHFATPGDAYENYPVTREKTIRDFFAALAEGGDKGVEKAFLLVSVRETGIVTSGASFFKTELHKFSEYLNKNNAAGWSNGITISFPQPDPYLGDEVFAEVVIGKEKFNIGMQAQMSPEAAALERRIPMKKKTPHKEDGKVRWGIGEVSNFPLCDGQSQRLYRPGSDVSEDEKPAMGM